MYFDTDPRFITYFKNLKQVFLYITDECNLRCFQCLYKPNLIFKKKKKEIKYNTVVDLISDFRELGAIKLTLIGGEPTLYGYSKNNKPLLKLIEEAKKIGYEYIRISTNGIFKTNLLVKSEFKMLDEIAFSLDGFTSEINDPIRGKGNFKKCVINIQKAIELGYNVSITCCIHKKLLERNKYGELLIDTMIKFAESLRLNIINFHDLFKCGVPMDTWTNNLNPTVESWIKAYNEISKKIKSNEYNISVRLPLCFITKEEFDKNPEYYGYCPVKLGERVMIHPNGSIRICSNLICSPYKIAQYYDKKIEWNNSLTNEILDHNLNRFTPCTNRGKINYGNFVPLCFSFKPNQEELIWKNLMWDDNKIEK